MTDTQALRACVSVIPALRNLAITAALHELTSDFAAALPSLLLGCMLFQAMQPKTEVHRTTARVVAAALKLDAPKLIRSLIASH
jgi:hypothetical protein